MELAKILVHDTTGACIYRKRIPAGIVGGTVSVEFAHPVWDGLQKTVIFRGNTVQPAKFDGTTAEIPWETVENPGDALYFGIWGNDPETGLQLPLIEVRIGQIEVATDHDAMPGTDPTLPVWAQQQAQIDVLKQQVGDLMENGQPSGPSTPGADGGYYTPQVTQPDAKTVRFGFTPSKQDMPAVDPVDVKLPAPDSGAASDWNAAEGEPGHILNRPFYSEISTVEILPETELPFDEDMGYMTEVSTIPAVGSNVTVVWNGTPYVCKVYDWSWEIPGAVILGNLYRAFGDDVAIIGVPLVDTGEPFVIMVAEIEGSRLVAAMPLEEIQSLTLSLTEKAEVAHPIPDKYLPKLRGQKTYVVDLDNLTASSTPPRMGEMDTAELQSCLTVIYDGVEHAAIIRKRGEAVINGVLYHEVGLIIMHQSATDSAFIYGTWNMNGVTRESYMDKDLISKFSGNTDAVNFYVRPSGSSVGHGWYPIDSVVLNRIKLQSPNGNIFTITVDDSGNLTASR